MLYSVNTIIKIKISAAGAAVNSFLYFFNVFIKFFFLLTPFFALSAFLSMTADKPEKQRKALALKITFSVCIACFVLFFFGTYIFLLFGITIDAFRVGAGGLLFITSVGLVQGKQADHHQHKNDDIVVVPLSIPIIAGPATIGAILVMSGEVSGLYMKTLSLVALFAAIFCVGIILFLAASIERILKRRGIIILSKLTGLILAALAAQMVFTGVRSFLK